MINIEKMLVGDLARLRNVIRFGVCRRTHDESVAEHSYYVVLYTMLLGLDYESRNAYRMVELDWRKLMVGSTLHDAEESVTGDFPRPYKYSSEKLKGELDNSAVEVTKEIMETLNSSPHVVNILNQYTIKAKDKETIEGRIIALADFLSVVSYIYQEYLAGNHGVASVIESGQSLREYYNSIDTQLFRQDFADVLDAVYTYVVLLDKESKNVSTQR